MHDETEVVRPPAGWTSEPERPECEVAVTGSAAWRGAVDKARRWKTRRRILRAVGKWALFAGGLVGAVLLAVTGVQP